jgi:RNA ligase
MFKKYESIPNLNNYVYELKKRWDYVGKDEESNPIYNNTKPYPTLTYTGKVKLHGSNTCIFRVAGDNTNYYQKRSTTIGVKNDLDSFAMSMSQYNLDDLFSQFECKESCYIYGEWCGKGIQKGTALNQLDKRIFVIFTIIVDGEYIESNINFPQYNIYNVNQISQPTLTIDFNNPSDVEAEITKLVDECEAVCPFVKQIFGISGVGEGYVWYLDNKPCFKTKGDKHKIVVLDTKNQNATEIPTYNQCLDFVRSVVCDNRLEQTKQELKIDYSKENIKQFVNWMIEDILKEEINSIIVNNLNVETIKNLIAKETANKIIKQCLEN